jgi:transketolase
VLALSRQDLPVLENSGDGLLRGAYVLQPGDDGTIVATGGEVWVAVAAREQLAAEGLNVSVVSMPSWELFEHQDQAYKDSVLPDRGKTVSVEAGVSMGWERYATTHVAIDRFGASAPGTEVLERFGFTADGIASVVREALG